MQEEKENSENILSTKSLPMINERVKKLIDYYANGSVKRFSEIIKLANSQKLNRVFNIDKRNNEYPEVSSDILLSVANMFPEVNSDWLLTGKGSMLKEETKDILPGVNYEYKGAPYYNVDFIVGFDLVLTPQIANPDYYINFEPYNKPGVVWCNITGHSMEPELNNGDFIAMKEMTTPIEYLPSGEIYGIITEDYRTVKRIRLSDKDGFVCLIPTNKSPEYREQNIPISMICKVFAVLGSMHRLF